MPTPSYATYVLLLYGTLLAVVGVRDTGASTDDAAALIRAVVAFIADAHQRARLHVRIADHALAVAYSMPSVPRTAYQMVAETRTLVTESSDGDAWLLAAHDQVGIYLVRTDRELVGWYLVLQVRLRTMLSHDVCV